MSGLGIFMRRRGIQSSPTKSNYIRFDDKQVEQICVANFSSDGIGLTLEDAAAVTNIGLIFRGNTTIESFDEFKYFTSVSYIGTGADASSGGAFAGCTSLKKITLPESLTDIRPFAFYGCTSLESINLENEHITIIGNEAFKNCGEMRVNINLPNLQILGSRVSADVFMYSGIVSIISLGIISKIWGYSESVHGTFLGCTNLTSAILPETLTDVGARAFQDCASLVEITLGSADTIGGAAFYRDVALRVINYDWSKLITLGSDAFRECTSLSLSNLNLTHVTTIGANAFFNCPLTFDELRTPSLVSIGSFAFKGVHIKKWLDMGKITTLTLAGADTIILEELIVPETITALPNSVFDEYTALNTLAIDWSKITNVGSYAIRRVPAFTNSELVISNLASASAYAFNGSLVKSIDLTGSPITFISRIFEQCPNLLTIVLPENTAGIGAYMARQSYSLKEIISKAVTPPTLNGDGLSMINSTFVIYVPDESVEAYRIATNWSNLADRIKPYSEYTN